MKLPPLQFNVKCLVLVGITSIMYYICMIGFKLTKKKTLNKRVFIATSILATYFIGFFLIRMYYKLYSCKTSNKTSAAILWALLGLVVPVAAFLVSMIKPNPSSANWRLQQLTRLFQWFYMVLILGILFYILMARFDIAYGCEFQMKPTIVSAPTAFLKGETYRQGFGKHMKSFAIWSAILYGAVFGITLPVTLLKNFSPNK